jgi:long-chain acyl-CoA synthetase
MGLNLGDCLRLSAEAHPQAPCLVYEGLRLDYASVDLAARKVATLLLEMGIGQGDRVALILPNIPQFPIVYYGILYAGATAVPLNPLLRPAELAHVAADAQLRAIFALADVAETALSVLGHSDVQEVFVVEPGMQPVTPPQGRSFLEAYYAADPVHDLALTNPEDIAVILYSAARCDAVAFQPFQQCVDHQHAHPALLSRRYLPLYPAALSWLRPDHHAQCPLPYWKHHCDVGEV